MRLRAYQSYVQQQLLQGRQQQQLRLWLCAGYSQPAGSSSCSSWSQCC